MTYGVVDDGVYASPCIFSNVASDIIIIIIVIIINNNMYL